MVTKIEVINKLWSHENKLVLQAVEELRVRGWLVDGSLRGVALCKTQFQDADLMGADLRGVDLHQAQLEFSDLSKANLTAAKLTRANLHGANLDQADLTRADLYKASLRRAHNLMDDQLSRAKRMWGAIMPDGSTYDGRYNLRGDLELALWKKIDTQDPRAMAEFYGVSVEAYLSGQGKEVKTPSPEPI
ncbi:MAG TPA: pentapeptide repeat-containing protein [Anaerolineales bacterium]|jgi:hypothetical protein|nr:pentapeptide repeat-containing protein [Anaerolineales bacterium]